MEKLPEEIYLKFKPDQIKSVRKLYNLDEKRIIESVDLLCDWVKKQEHFRKKNLPREYLERFVINSKGSVEVAKTRLDKLCTSRTLWPESFSVLDINYFKKYDKIFVSILMPEMTDVWTRVKIVKTFSDQSLPSDILGEYVKYENIMTSYLFNNDYSHGLVVLYDLRDVNIMDYLSILDATHLSQLTTLIMKAYGFSIKGIHFLTTSKLSDLLVSFFKQFLSKKVGDRIRVHGNIETVYEFIPKRNLPADYGGEGPSMSKLRDDFFEELSSKDHIEHMKEMNTASTDESRRPKTVFNDLYVNMPGSFRSLSVD